MSCHTLNNVTRPTLVLECLVQQYTHDAMMRLPGLKTFEVNRILGNQELEQKKKPRSPFNGSTGAKW